MTGGGKAEDVGDADDEEIEVVTVGQVLDRELDALCGELVEEACEADQEDVQDDIASQDLSYIEVSLGIGVYA